MSTTTQPNDTAKPATVPQILARLILIQQGRELPDPISLEANADHQRAEVKVRDRAAFDSWLDAVGGRQADINSARRVDGTVLSWAIAWGWHGEWRVSVELTEAAAAEPTMLDADTVAGLEAVAAEPTAEPVISDDARKILDALNGFADSLGPNVTEALDWAMRQPEVASTDGPNAEGEYQVELLDFSAIEWRPSENRWTVTVSDDTESEVSR